MVTGKEKRQQIKLTRSGGKSCYGRGEDTHKLHDIAESTYANLPAPSISELIMQYNGDKYVVAYELARQELGSKGTEQEYKRAYARMLNDINRYLRKVRSPSKAMQTRFKKLYTPESKKNLRVKIRGCVHVSNEYYYKDSTWNNPVIIPASEVKAFLQASIENNETGYRILNGFYMGLIHGLLNDTFIWLDNVEIDMSFT